MTDTPDCRGREAVKQIVEALQALNARLVVVEKRAANHDDVLAGQQREIAKLADAVMAMDRVHGKLADWFERIVPPDPPKPPDAIN